MIDSKISLHKLCAEKKHCAIRTKTKISPSFEVLYETEGTEVVAHLCLSARGTFCFLGWCL